MTAKQYLAQLAKLKVNIGILQEAIIRERSKLESTSVPLKPDKVQSSQHGDVFADAIARLADKDMQRQEMMLIYEMLYDQIVDQILDIPDSLESLVLYQRYVKTTPDGLFRPWKVISDEQHYSIQYLARVHKEALVTFTKLYGPNFLPVYKNMR